MNNEQLREEFKKWYISAWSQNGGLSEQEVADWWLNKMEEALSHQKAELAKKIDGMGFKDPRDAEQFTLHAQGYNQAIEDVLSLLDTPTNLLK